MPITDSQFREVVEMVRAAYKDGQGSMGELIDASGIEYFENKYSMGYIEHDVRLIFGGVQCTKSKR